MPLQDSADVELSLPTPSSLHLTALSPLTVSWNPDSLVPMTDPDSFRVDITISRMDLDTGVWSRAETVAHSLPNNGRAFINNIPAIVSGNMGNNIIGDIGSNDELFPVAVEVVVATAPRVGDTPLTTDERKRRQVGEENLLSRVVGAVRRWSTMIFYSASNALLQPCQSWCDDQPDNIGEELLSRLPPCPPRVEQARAQNSGFKEDSGVARFLSRNFFHRGADTCFRQTTFDR